MENKIRNGVTGFGVTGFRVTGFRATGFEVAGIDVAGIEVTRSKVDRVNRTFPECTSAAGSRAMECAGAAGR